MIDGWQLEEQYPGPVCGVDEAGRGPLVGIVVAAAVILPRDFDVTGLDDSKKMTAKRREELFERITSTAVFCIAEASVAEIEELNIRGAALLAMRRAVESLPEPPHTVLVDGNAVDGLGDNAIPIVKGDGRCFSIAAASVLAKVYRDHKMQELDAQYPQYGFARHKGYGTAAHYQALDRYGPCPEHRPTFLRTWFARQSQT